MLDKKQIANNILAGLATKENLLVAVSGGVDSMVLLDILYQLGYWKLTVLHYHHGLRNTADRDSQLVEEKCKKYKIKYIQGKGNVQKEKEKNKGSLELVARHMRWEFFQTISKQENIKNIALAHHRDDQVETLMIRLARGTSIAGLAGMQPLYKGTDGLTRLRPLLPYTKTDIYKYAKQHNIQYYEDETNTDTSIERNWWRKDILPAIRNRKAGLDTAIYRLSGQATEIAEYMSISAKNWLKNQKKENILWKHKDWTNLHTAIQKEILTQLYIQLYDSRQELETTHIVEIIRWLANNRGGSSRKYGNTYTLKLQKGEISITPPPK